MTTSNEWIDYVESSCGPEIRAQFERALARNLRGFIDEILVQNVGIITPEKHYYGLSDRMEVVGRNQDMAEEVALDLCEERDVDWTPYQFVTNPLLPVQPDHDLYRSPSQRVVCGPHYVFTYEFDEKDLSFFRQQLGWFRYASRPTNSRIGRLYTELSHFSDFVGISVCYSGNKSFHVHCAFDPNYARAAYALDTVAASEIRAGFIAHWHVLKEVVLRVLQPTLNGKTVEPDAMLRYPEWYRRLPGGSRLITPKANKPDWKHALGIPFGTRVPQVTMWEQFRKQAAKETTALFFRPGPFREQTAAAAKRRNETATVAVASKRQHGSGYSDDVLAYIEAKLSEQFPAGSYPEFVRLERDDRSWIARFRNSAADTNPSSIMRGDHRTVLLAGKDAHLITTKSLPQPLIAMMRLWRGQVMRAVREVELGIAPQIAAAEEEDEDDLEFVLDARHTPGESFLEQRFQRRALTKADVGPATRSFFRRALRESACIYVKGPEGGGKSSALTRQHDQIVSWLADRKKPTLTMYAFTDYETAEKKCIEFFDAELARRKRRGRKRAQDRDYRPVLLRSFSDAYREACENVGCAPITLLRAMQMGCSSVWGAITRYQPAVLDVFREMHRSLWVEIGVETPVFFTVHAVAQVWRTYTPTRTMWGRRFWEYAGDPSDWRARADTELGLLVHDEVSFGDLIVMERAEIVEWVSRMMQAAPSVWFDRRAGAEQQHTAFQTYRAQMGPPTVNGVPAAIEFDHVRALIAGGMQDWTEVTLSAAGAYPEYDPAKPLYTAPVVNGHRWMVRPRYWWRDHRTPTGRLSKSSARIADRVVMLTTEELPTAVLRVADPGCWSIYSLETPHIGRDEVAAEFDKSVTSSGVTKAVTKLRKKVAGLPVISNKVAALTGTQTPISARGSNEYIGRDLAQTLMYAAPELHEQMLVLNAYTGRDDCVALYHMDLLNQTCGRNMGYRRQGGATHTILANRRLFAFLLDVGAFAYSRYDVVLHLTKKQRARIRAAAAATQPEGRLPE